MKIRLAVPEEAEEIAAVLREAFADIESFYTPEAFSATIPDAGEIRGRFAEGATWVALKNGRIVGTVSAVPHGEKLYFRSMAVAPSEQGSGAGRKLLDAVERYAIENKFKSLLLYTTPFQKVAIPFYERSGFVRTAEGEADEFFGTPWFEMEKDLSVL